MSFEQAVAIVLKHEGGYSNDPRDPGGETRFGISKRAYPDVDIRNLKVADAENIYRRDYWDTLRPDELPQELAICLFDCAVNMGRDKAIRLLQRACGVAQDGVMGGNTIAAANRLVDPVVRFSAERVIAYTGIRGFDTFGKGWLRRTVAVALEASK
jgi:lysozyme family protein